MDHSTYVLYFWMCCVLPTVIALIILFILWRCNRDIEELILLVVMKSIISKNNLNEEPSLFVCNRVLSKHRHFVIISMFIIWSCLQLFSIVAILDISNACINDPNLDCFKDNDDNQSPVNCSSLTQDDFVTCYRITAFDPERAFIGASAAYLLLKMINVALFMVAHIMLWAARKWGRKTVRRVKFGFALVVSIVFLTQIILVATLDEFKSASKKFAPAVYYQAVLIAITVINFTWLPWETFQESKEYFRDVSLPKNVDANEHTRLILEN